MWVRKVSGEVEEGARERWGGGVEVRRTGWVGWICCKIER